MASVTRTQDQDLQVVGRSKGRALIYVLRRHWAISLIVALFIVLGGLYNAVTPPFEAPDETAHFRYVQHLANGQGLPPLRAAEALQQGEMHQPPLYYALGALFTAGLNTGEPDEAYVLNPYAALGMPDSPGNKNAVLHNGAEPAPPAGVPLAVHILRGLSSLFAAVTVVLTYAIARELLPYRLPVALGAAALVAFNPQFLFIGSAVSNDPLASMLATATLYQALRVTNGRARGLRTAILLGVTSGLGTLTKTNALATLGLIPLGYALYYLSEPRERRPRPIQIISHMSLAFAMALAVGGWWYVRNAIQFGDPFTMNTMESFFGTYEQPLSLAHTWRLIKESFVSFWGVFGWMNILADEAYYVFVRILTGLGVIGLALSAVWYMWRRRKGSDLRGHAAGLVAIWVLVVLASYAQFTRTVTGPQGRLLFPAIAGIAFFLSLGLTSWVPTRYGNALVGGIASIFLIVSAVAPFRYIAPAYAAPFRVPLEQAPAQMNDLAITFGEDMFLLGSEVLTPSVGPGDHLRLRLYWVAKADMAENLTISLRVYGRDQAIIGEMDTYPAMGAYPTSAWIPGEVIYDEYSIPISPDAIVPVAVRIRVGVYRVEDMSHLTAYDAQERDIGTGPEVGRARVAHGQQPSYKPQFALMVNYADRVMLEGYSLRNRVYAGDRVVEIVFYWRCLAPLPQDWTVFAHIVDENGQVVAQADEQPLEGDYPTSFWQQDEVVEDTHALLVTEDLRSGRYMINVGLYLLETGERLPIAGGDPAVNYISIGPLIVESH